MPGVFAMRDDLDIPFPAMLGAQSGSYSPRAARQGMDPNTKRLAIIAGSIGGALLLLMGGWSLMGHRHGGVPVIQADSRPLRERPLNKGGLAVEGANETILSGDHADGKTIVAPAPEAPALAALKAMPPAVVVAAAVPAQVAPTAVQAATPAPVLRVAPISAAVQEPLLNASRPTPAVRQAPPRVLSPAPSTLAAPAAAPALAQAAHHPSAPAAVAATGHAEVQLAAVGSEAAAHGEWQRLSAKYPALLGGRHVLVSRTEHGGKTYWRLRVPGFADSASAGSFCTQMRDKGGNCAVAHS